MEKISNSNPSTVEFRIFSFKPSICDQLMNYFFAIQKAFRKVCSIFLVAIWLEASVCRLFLGFDCRALGVFVNSSDCLLSQQLSLWLFAAASQAANVLLHCSELNKGMYVLVKPYSCLWWLIICRMIEDGNWIYWNLNPNAINFDSVENIVCKMAAILFQSQCVNSLCYVFLWTLNQIMACCQAIVWMNADQSSIIKPGKYFNEILFKIFTFSFMKMYLK